VQGANEITKRQTLPKQEKRGGKKKKGKRSLGRSFQKCGWFKPQTETIGLSSCEGNRSRILHRIKEKWGNQGKNEIAGVTEEKLDGMEISIKRGSLDPRQKSHMGGRKG